MTGARCKTINDVYDHLHEMGQHDSAYWDKQMHKIPDAKVMDRGEYIIGFCKDKIVLDIGASGVLHEALKQCTTKLYGIDKEGTPSNTFRIFNLDQDCLFDPNAHVSEAYPLLFEGVEVVLCAETLEHLSNPGKFLYALRKTYPDIPLLITVPNAGGCKIRNKYENVNRDHVAWYSYTTLKELLRRYGYKIEQFYWYNGKPYTAEGLIVVAR